MIFTPQVLPKLHSGAIPYKEAGVRSKVFPTVSDGLPNTHPRTISNTFGAPSPILKVVFTRDNLLPKGLVLIGKSPHPFL